MPAKWVQCPAFCVFGTPPSTCRLASSMACLTIGRPSLSLHGNQLPIRAKPPLSAQRYFWRKSEPNAEGGQGAKFPKVKRQTKMLFHRKRRKKRGWGREREAKLKKKEVPFLIRMIPCLTLMFVSIKGEYCIYGRELSLSICYQSKEGQS